MASVHGEGATRVLTVYSQIGHREKQIQRNMEQKYEGFTWSDTAVQWGERTQDAPLLCLFLRFLKVLSVNYARF